MVVLAVVVDVVVVVVMLAAWWVTSLSFEAVVPHSCPWYSSITSSNRPLKG